MTGHAIFLNGPIGVGKTALGRRLADNLGGGFIDGDDHSDPNKAWYGSIKTTSESIVRAGLAVLASRPVVVIAYPLRRTTWIYHCRRFGDAGVRPLFVTLRAKFENIVAPLRGRSFTEAEQARIRVMIAECYDARTFSDVIIDTDRTDFASTLAVLTAESQRLLARG